MDAATPTDASQPRATDLVGRLNVLLAAHRAPAGASTEARLDEVQQAIGQALAKVISES
jgi:hypothetical protein